MQYAYASDQITSQVGSDLIYLIRIGSDRIDFSKFGSDRVRISYLDEPSDSKRPIRSDAHLYLQVNSALSVRQ